MLDLLPTQDLSEAAEQRPTAEEAAEVVMLASDSHTYKEVLLTPV
jgi:hypothetical protein